MTTFEEKYRKKPTPEAAPVTPAQASGMEVLKDAAKTEYEAYRTAAHRKLKLWIKTGSANDFPYTSIPYNLVNHIMTDGAGFAISLLFSGPLNCVELHGRNLQELHEKLLDDEVAWVQEFDPRKWAAPGEQEPCITGIKISRATPKKDDAVALPGERKEPERATH
jgi:hypothetical protein